jgi:DNA-binding response OmpR family regulator
MCFRVRRAHHLLPIEAQRPAGWSDPLMPTSNDRYTTTAAQAVRVLIVSDDTTMSAELTAVLYGSGCIVEIVTAPEQALDACASQAFRMAIVDESVCQMAGPELARALRDFFAVPTLFLSAEGDPEMISTAIEDGSLGFIIKPLSTASLLPVLELALERALNMQLKTPRSALRHELKH